MTSLLRLVQWCLCWGGVQNGKQSCCDLSQKGCIAVILGSGAKQSANGSVSYITEAL